MRKNNKERTLQSMKAVKDLSLSDNKTFYIWLFFTHFFISAFTFGGGYVVIPMIRKYFVQKKHYFTEEELLDLSAIAQSCPGAIAVNLAVLTGYKTASFQGALLSMIASVLPPFIILSIIYFWYAGFRDNPFIAFIFWVLSIFVSAYIFDFVLDMAKTIQKEKSYLLYFLAFLAFLCSILRMNIIIFLLSCIAVCAFTTWFSISKFKSK